MNEHIHDCPTCNQYTPCSNENCEIDQTAKCWDCLYREMNFIRDSIFGSPDALSDEEIALLSKIIVEVGSTTPRFIPPRNEHGYGMWTVDGWSSMEWTRTTNIGDQVESRWLRMDGPTKREADKLSLILNTFPKILRTLINIKSNVGK